MYPLPNPPAEEGEYPIGRGFRSCAKSSAVVLQRG